MKDDSNRSLRRVNRKSRSAADRTVEVDSSAFFAEDPSPTPQGTVGIILHRKSPFERKAQSAGTMVSTARAGRQVAVWSSLDSQPKLSQMWSGQGESTKRAAPSLISMCTV